MQTIKLTYALIPLLLLSACGDGSTKQKKPPAEEPSGLVFPLACTLGEDCWVARYVDRTKGPGLSDYRCGARTQDGHAGTDIAVANLGRMKAGVDVLAAAAGTVLRLRDGEPDESVKARGLEEVKGRECGNGLVIRHQKGLESQYCHLKAGSFKVKVGDTVKAGQPVAELGLSGETEYPHVHYMVRENGKVVDPFDGGLYEGGCGSGTGRLWARDIPYEPGVLLPLQFSDHVRSRADVWAAPQVDLSRHSKALVLMARGFHVRKGDRWHLAIFDPRGKLFLEKEVVMPADKQFYFQYIGRKVGADGLMPGLWSGVLTLKGPSEDAGTEPQKLKARVLVRED